MAMRRFCGVYFAVSFLATGVFAAYAPDSVYEFVDNVVAVEAEDLAHNDFWELSTNPPGATGRGFLKYVGPPQECYYMDGDEAIGNDTTGECQGTLEDRLLIPVAITTPGSYSCNIRMYQETYTESPSEGGADFTVWIHIVDWPLPVKYNNAESLNTWDWLKFGPDYPGGPNPGTNIFLIRPGEEGIYTFYVAGRSQNFRADRIHIFRKIGRELFPANAINPQAPLSPKVAVSDLSLPTRTRRAAVEQRGLQRGTISAKCAVFDLRGARVAPASSRAVPRGVYVRANTSGAVLRMVQ